MRNVKGGQDFVSTNMKLHSKYEFMIRFHSSIESKSIGNHELMLLSTPPKNSKSNNNN